ncbi:MAG: SemiSWEET transporter [Candidatus Eisenbacteria bacterium]|uniref:SemiSWEET transporter n=1 Tax=Eiseniibacteriota bacterium TaxID=2212470 RepID=A0A956N8V0_UNCEI|nr:SemiSWEET transporter [Candidatus Eisenbacteria bacterium]MCB9465202.1 SemiSWEET transporter [Candidatus Eisenbacteria bacterium]
MQTIDLIGSIAGALTTFAFLPQVIQTWRTRSAGDLSIAWLATFSAGVLLWAAYGFVLRSWPIIATNVLTLMLVSSLTVIKVREMETWRTGRRR